MRRTRRGDSWIAPTSYYFHARLASGAFYEVVNAVYLVFFITYLLIASRRLSLLPIGRPAGVLLGAVLMVLIGALSPKETYSAIDYDMVVLLFGTMVLTVYLERAGFFEWIAVRIVSVFTTPMKLLLAVSALQASQRIVIILNF